MTLLLPILLPLIGGAILPLLPFGTRRARSIYVEAVAGATSLLLLFLVAFGGETLSRPWRMTESLALVFGMDGLSRVFCCLIAVLWPLATLYGFSYMEHEGGERRFFAWYLMSYGVTCGIATARNLFTLYVLYELLTLVTLPLVLHGMSAERVHAGRKYLYYSIGGAALAFIGLIFVFEGSGGTTDFRFGGVLSAAMSEEMRALLPAVYLITFVGFGAKAAVFPLHGWLPQASVAPTPVTALLHAVAVVKAGAFAVIRMTYYSFGTELLRGTWAQTAAVLLAAFTIVYGSVNAVREQHLKRRLAWSTVSNLSYILLGAALMTPAGLTGALTHMLFHGAMKITLFFCAGAILVRTRQEYVQDVRGFGRIMPVTMGVFVFASLALAGVPPLPGFVSKWNLATAAVECGWPGAVGAGALIVSAVLTAAYLFPVCIGAYFRPVNESLSPVVGTNRDPDWRMKAPLLALCGLILALSVCAGPLTDWLGRVAAGLL